MEKSFIMRARLIACLFFVSTLSYAKILKDEVSIVDEKIYSYHQVCKFLTKRESPLISFSTVTKLDCMGKIVEVSKFCDEKTQDDPYYIRAVVSKEKKEVICKSAKRVHIKYECESQLDEFCQDKEVGCYLMQEKFAKRLKTDHASLINKGAKKELNCHFTPKIDQMDKPLDQI